MICHVVSLNEILVPRVNNRTLPYVIPSIIGAGKKKKKKNSGDRFVKSKYIASKLVLVKVATVFLTATMVQLLVTEFGTTYHISLLSGALQLGRMNRLLLD